MKSFKSPKEVRITGRTSSITGAFANSIVPNIKPSSEQLREAYAILKLDDDNLKCAYCGMNDATEWDHFRSTVNNKQHTGYLAEIYNLVPACGKCNQSKGAKYWKDWIRSNAKLSPGRRGVENLDELIKRLDEYEAWSRDKVEKVRYENLDDETRALLKQHWENCENIINMMKKSQELADKIKAKIKSYKGWD